MDYNNFNKKLNQNTQKIMVLTASTMLPLGTKAPEFHLPEVVNGKIISLENFADKKALLIMACDAGEDEGIANLYLQVDDWPGFATNITHHAMQHIVDADVSRRC